MYNTRRVAPPASLRLGGQVHHDVREGDAGEWVYVFFLVTPIFLQAGLKSMDLAIAEKAAITIYNVSRGEKAKSNIY